MRAYERCVFVQGDATAFGGANANPTDPSYSELCGLFGQRASELPLGDPAPIPDLNSLYRDPETKPCRSSRRDSSRAQLRSCAVFFCRASTSASAPPRRMTEENSERRVASSLTAPAR